jgi:hypothetical protein
MTKKEMKAVVEGFSGLLTLPKEIELCTICGTYREHDGPCVCCGCDGLPKQWAKYRQKRGSK